MATSTAGSSPYSQLPPAVRLEDTRTSQDAESRPDELEDGFRETQWLLRTCPG